MFSKQKRHEAYSKLVTHIGMLSNLKHSMSITLTTMSMEHAAMQCSCMVRRGETSIHPMSCATTWPSQQTNQQQCFPQPKMHVLCAKFYTLIWCKGHVPNQELIEAVGHSCSACDDGLITPTMHNLLPLRSET